MKQTNKKDLNVIIKQLVSPDELMSLWKKASAKLV